MIRFCPHRATHLQTTPASVPLVTMVVIANTLPAPVSATHAITTEHALMDPVDFNVYANEDIRETIVKFDRKTANQILA